MGVHLIAHTPEPERVVAAAARLCYSASSAAELVEKLSHAEVSKLIKIILRSGHMSVCEHASFTFAIDGISRACSHQLVRHRLASYSQQSQRYVRLSDPRVIYPPAIEAEGGEPKRLFDEAVGAGVRHYQELLAAGAEPEDARYALPQAIETKIVVTMNARELLHFFTLRTCQRAQWEIRHLAEEMLKLAYPQAIRIFAKAGPACIRGRCPEGKFYCGKPRLLTDEGLIEIPEQDWVFRSDAVRSAD